MRQITARKDHRETTAGRPRGTRWGAVSVFVCLAYGAAWGLLWPAVQTSADLSDPVGSPGAYIATVAMMFTPGLAALLVAVMLQRHRGKALLVELGLTGFFTRQGWRFAGAGIAGAAVLVLGSWSLGLLLGWVQLDPERSVARELIIRVTGEQPPMPMALLALLQLVNLPIGIAITAIAATGEEIGWRGWLLPKLLPLGTGWALSLSGAIWGLWHAPAILLGLNYEQRDPLGIIMMTIGCVGAGVLIGWLRLASGSLLPCVLAHAALNSFATYQSILFPPFDQRLVGPLAITGWIVMTVLIVTGVLRATRLRQRRDSERGSHEIRNTEASQ
ncbi:CPBP family intramembrane glutamic endopeptidase [Curtobacterium sp. SORGH_AS_0776]|uniref:CPBP family intramembrane glutamic endopeptidase n=1 Tax=Curtobacterium sp. SORGH_AS_0776 TaxID=3041798 RepID=UPI0028542D0C|nr:CPBP family intramembrane glutamic endopeptidase [Curtobacterium sp. SORGH_AS_0776]MDR6169143.1 membrane protease YdiL (CAAX protease family) [Curtobacterium sp. SORGH_AS_0776]